MPRSPADPRSPALPALVLQSSPNMAARATDGVSLSLSPPPAAALGGAVGGNGRAAYTGPLITAREEELEEDLKIVVGSPLHPLHRNPRLLSR